MGETTSCLRPCEMNLWYRRIALSNPKGDKGLQIQSWSASSKFQILNSNFSLPVRKRHWTCMHHRPYFSLQTTAERDVVVVVSVSSLQLCKICTAGLSKLILVTKLLNRDMYRWTVTWVDWFFNQMDEKLIFKIVWMISLGLDWYIDTSEFCKWTYAINYVR